MTALCLRSSWGLGLSQSGRRRAHQPAPFSPAALSDLAFWYDAEQSPVIENGGALEQWADLSGNANHASQSTGVERPLKTTDEGSNDVIRFDGVDDVLNVTAPPDLANGLTLFVIFRVRAHTDSGAIVSAASAADIDHEQYFSFQYLSTTDQQVQLLSKSLQVDPVDIRRVDSTQVQYALFAISADSAELRDLNGQATDSSTAVALGTPDVFALGAGIQDGSPFNWGAIDIYEIGAYPRVLTDPELEQLETYCVARRGLAWNPMHLGTDLQWFHDASGSGFTQSGGMVSQWDDLTDAQRHWIQSGNARPAKTIDGQGREVVRFDGIDDVMLMTGGLPALEPFSLAVVYTLRAPNDLAGIVTAAPESGVDHVSFWTLRLAANEDELQLFGRSQEIDPLDIVLPHGGDAHIAIWTMEGGSAELIDAAGSETDTYDGAFGTAAEIVLGGRYDGAPFGFAEIDVMATLGIARTLSVEDRQRLLDWIASRWGS
jgi:hypothetical protein